MGATIARIDLAHLRSSTRNLNRGWPLAWLHERSRHFGHPQFVPRFRRISSAKRVRVVATTIVSNLCIDTRFMPERIWSIVACFVLITKFSLGNEFFRIYILSQLAWKLFSQNVFRFDWIVDSICVHGFYWEFYSLLFNAKF